MVGVDTSHIIHKNDSFTKYETFCLLENERHKKKEFAKRRNLFANCLVEMVNETGIRSDAYTIYFSNIGEPEHTKSIIFLGCFHSVGTPESWTIDFYLPITQFEQ
jgi:hypothetical protein